MNSNLKTGVLFFCSFGEGWVTGLSNLLQDSDIKFVLFPALAKRSGSWWRERNGLTRGFISSAETLPSSLIAAPRVSQQLG